MDVPKLGVKMDYQPPELLYNQLYQEGDGGSRPPRQPAAEFPPRQPAADFPPRRSAASPPADRPTPAPFLPTPSRFVPPTAAPAARFQPTPRPVVLRTAAPAYVRSPPTPVPVYQAAYSRSAQEPARGYPPTMDDEDLNNEIDTGFDFNQIQKFHKRTFEDEVSEVRTVRLML